MCTIKVVVLTSIVVPVRGIVLSHLYIKRSAARRREVVGVAATWNVEHFCSEGRSSGSSQLGFAVGLDSEDLVLHLVLVCFILIVVD